MTERTPGCFDAFPIPGSYNEQQWIGMRNKPREMLQIIKYNQTGFLGTVLIHFGLFLVWCLATRLPGFNLYDGSSSVNANTHSGWWLMLDALVLGMSLLAPFFTLHYIREGEYETVETGVKHTASFLLAYQVVAVIGSIVTVVHFALSLGELRECSSATFCRDFYWAQIALIVLLALLAILLLWSAGMAGTYRANIQGAGVWGGVRPTILTTEISARDSAAPMEVVVTAPGGGGGDMMKSSQIMTPLLQMRLQQQQQQQSGKFRHVAGNGGTAAAMIRMK